MVVHQMRNSMKIPTRCINKDNVHSREFMEPMLTTSFQGDYDGEETTVHWCKECGCVTVDAMYDGRLRHSQSGLKFPKVLTSEKIPT